MRLARGRKIIPTAQSRRGHSFVGPAGEGYRNRGKVILRGRNRLGRRIQVGVNLAEGVKQTLLSAAEMNDSDNIVVLDSSGEHHGSKLFPANTPEGRAVRKAVAAARGTPIDRVKNTYKMKRGREQ